MSRFVFGCDPGARHEKHVDSKRGTGWCLVFVPDDVSAEPVLLEHGQVVGGPDEWLDAINLPSFGKPAYHALMQATEYVVEGFTKRIAAAKIDPLEIVGMMRMSAAIRGIRCDVSRPVERIIVTHEDLKRIGWWPGGAGHADTAQSIRHVLATLIQEGHPGTSRLISPPDAVAPVPTAKKPGDGRTAPQINDLW